MPIGDWSSNPGLMATKKDATHILSMERQINDAICIFVTATVSMAKADLSSEDKARVVSLCSKAAQAAKRVTESLRTSLSHLDLNPSILFLTQWLTNLTEMAAAMKDHLMASESDTVLQLSKAVDASCPRWGSIITDTTIDMELCKLQLLHNESVKSLPTKVRSLANGIQMLKATATALGIEDPAGHTISRDTIRVATNSFAWGKRTVNIAAAVKVCNDPPEVAAATVDMVLKLGDSLPRSLRDCLERIKTPLEEGGAGGGESAQEAQPPSGSSTRAAGKPGHKAKAKRQKQR